MSAHPARLELREFNAPLPVRSLLLQLPNLVLDADVVNGTRLVPARAGKAEGRVSKVIRTPIHMRAAAGPVGYSRAAALCCETAVRALDSACLRLCVAEVLVKAVALAATRSELPLQGVPLLLLLGEVGLDVVQGLRRACVRACMCAQVLRVSTNAQRSRLPPCLRSLASGELQANELLVLGVDRLHVLLVLDLELVKVHKVQHLAHLLLMCKLRLQLRNRRFVRRVLERDLLQQHLFAVDVVLKKPACAERVCQGLCGSHACMAGGLQWQR